MDRPWKVRPVQARSLTVFDQLSFQNFKLNFVVRTQDNFESSPSSGPLCITCNTVSTFMRRFGLKTITLTVLNDHSKFDAFHPCAVADCTWTTRIQIARGREELECHPPGDAGWGEALFNLARSLTDGFKEIAGIEDLEEAIALNRQALAHPPTGHPDRHWSLCELARCLHDRYNKLTSVADLDEAITLSRAGLDFDGHPDRSYSFHDLSTY